MYLFPSFPSNKWQTRSQILGFISVFLPHLHNTIEPYVFLGLRLLIWVHTPMPCDKLHAKLSSNAHSSTIFLFGSAKEVVFLSLCERWGDVFTCMVVHHACALFFKCLLFVLIHGNSRDVAINSFDRVEYELTCIMESQMFFHANLLSLMSLSYHIWIDVKRWVWQAFVIDN